MPNGNQTNPPVKNGRNIRLTVPVGVIALLAGSTGGIFADRAFMREAIYDQLDAHNREAATIYVRKDIFASELDHIKEQLDRIEEAINK